MMEKKKRFISVVHEFRCCGQVFQQPDFVDHMKDVHGYQKGTQCQRSLVQALDGSDLYSNTYKWEVPVGDQNITVIETRSGPRHKTSLLSDRD